MIFPAFFLSYCGADLTRPKLDSLAIVMNIDTQLHLSAEPNSHMEAKLDSMIPE